MNVIAFLGSPRKDGNSDTLLKSAIKGIEDSGQSVKVFNLARLKIKPCLNCGQCDSTGVCYIKDDMVEVASAIRKADRIILASPIFFMGVSAQAKAMIDRCQQFWCEKYILKRSIEPGPYGRKGLLLLVGGMKKEIGVNCASATATAFFRTISIPEHKVLSYIGVDAKGEILKHLTALKDTYDAGAELVK